MHSIENIVVSVEGFTNKSEVERFKVYTLKQIDQIPQLAKLDSQTIWEMKVVASVLPFRVNEYVIKELIDWDNIPNDPIYQLTFPQKDMLDKEIFRSSIIFTFKAFRPFNV